MLVITKSDRSKKLPDLMTVLKRKQSVGLTQGGSSSKFSGAKRGARDGQTKGKF